MKSNQIQQKKKSRHSVDCAGQWVLITGASGGIGQAAARTFWNRGACLVLTGRNKHKLITLKRQLLEGIGSPDPQQPDPCMEQKIVCIAVDLAKENAAERLYDQLQRRQLTIDILVNNAGVGDHCPFADSAWSRQRAILDVNITALTHLTWLFLQDMTQRNCGKILNIASVASYGPGPYLAVYYASKAYVLSFSLALSQELRGQGINVCCVCPGRTKSGFDEQAHMHRKEGMGLFPPADPDRLMERAVDGLMAHKDLVLDGALTYGMAAASHLLSARQMAWMMKQINQMGKDPQ